MALDIDRRMGAAQGLPAAVCIPEHIAAEGLPGAAGYLSRISGRDTAGFALRRWEDNGRMAVSHEKREGMASICLSSYPCAYLPGWVLIQEEMDPDSEEALDYVERHIDRVHFGRPELDFHGTDIEHRGGLIRKALAGTGAHTRTLRRCLRKAGSIRQSRSYTRSVSSSKNWTSRMRSGGRGTGSISR